MDTIIERYTLWLLWGVIAIAGLLGIVALCEPARAADCRPFFVKQQVAYIAPIVAAPVYYQAGVGIEQDALAAKVAKIVVGQLRAELKAGTQQQTASASTSALAQHCAKCHSGSAPKAGVVIDGMTLMACSQITASLRSIAKEEMPKDHKLTPEQKGAVMQELLSLEAPRDSPVVSD